MNMNPVLINSRIYESACASGMSDEDAIALAHGMSLIAEPLQAVAALFSEERRFRTLSPADVLQAVSAFAKAGHPALAQILDVVRDNPGVFRVKKARNASKRDAFSIAGQLTEAARGKRP